MPAAPAVTVAVLTYDGRALLEVVLPSLAAQTFRDFRTVVVDNGSSDGTAEWLASEWPDVEVIRLPENVGVTPALNVCLEAGRGSELVALLNNDIELDPESIGELVRAMREHPEAGSAGGKLRDFYDRGVIDGAGDLFAWAGTGDRRGHGEPDRGQYDEPREIFGACGGAALYRGAALAEVGGFDPAYVAFYEDTDWALRAQLAGWGCRYVPSAVVYHMGSATIGRGMTDFTQYQLWRNTVWLIAKNYPLEALLRHLPRILYVQAAQLYVAARGRRLPLWWRATRDAAKGVPAALRKRSSVLRRGRPALRHLEAVVAADQPPPRLRIRRPPSR